MRLGNNGTDYSSSPGLALAAALLEEGVEAAINRRFGYDTVRTPQIVPGVDIYEVRLNSKTVNTIAAQPVELLPALPEGRTGLTRIEFRDLGRQSTILANGAEGLFGNFVETMIESNASGFENRLGSVNIDELAEGKEPTSKDKFVDIYNTWCRNVNGDENGRSLPNHVRGMDAFQQKFIWHYWTTGLITVFYTWGQFRVPALGMRAYRMPVEMVILDPLRVDLDEYATKGIVWYEYTDQQRQALEAEIKLYGNPEKHPFFSIFPTKVNKKDPAQQGMFTPKEAYAELRNNRRVPLPKGNFKVYRRLFNDTDVYPTPFAARIFAPINDKRSLRNADRSQIRKVIMMILQIAVKSSDRNRPVRPLNLSRTIDALQTQLQTDPEYLQVVSLPAEANMSWLVPDMKHIYDSNKYRTVDFEILAAMVGLVASQILDGSGDLDLSLVGEQLWRKNNLCLQMFKRFLEEMYDEITLESKVRLIKPSDVKVIFKGFSMFQTDAFKTFIGNLVARGQLPVELAVDNMGEDFNTVVEKLFRQWQIMQKFPGMFGAPPTNVQVNQPGTDEESTDKSGPSPGRKPGTQDTKKRERDSDNEDDAPPPSQN